MKNKVKKMDVLIGFNKHRKPVGVKFIKNKEEYEKTNIQEASHQMFFCMMVKSATVGHSLKVKREHIYCSARSESLGFSKPSDDLLSGKVGFKRNMYETEEVSSKMAKKVPYINHDVYGMVIQPLENYIDNPDVVILFLNPYKAMRVVQSYSYKFGPMNNIHFAGMGGICTELMARAYKYNDISISLLCSGTRFAAEWKDEEMGIAFPYSKFEMILDGIEKTSNTFEPDDKKAEIKKRMIENDITLNEELVYGENYHGSSLGIARMGVKGYRKKSSK